MNPIRHEIADLLDGLVKLAHIVAAIAAVRMFVELSDPTNTIAAIWILLGIALVGLADVLVTFPLRRIADVIRSTTQL